MFEALQQELHANQNRLFLLLSFLYDRDAILKARDTCFAAGIQPNKRAYALEIVEMVVPREISRQFVPMLDDPMTPNQRLEKLNETFPQQTLGHDARLAEIITLTEDKVYDWTIACALDAIAVHHLTDNRQNIILLLASDNQLLRQSAARSLFKLFGDESRTLLTPLVDDPNIGPFVNSLLEDTPMLSTVEKVFALKNVEIFSETPENVLVAITDIMDEIDLEPGEALFEKGDVGSTMYIIFSGEMRVHDGDRTLTIRKDGDVFGEINLLDTSNRTASLSAVNEVRLLRLEQEPFFVIMAEYPAVSRGIIRMLTHRLREATDTLSGAKMT